MVVEMRRFLSDEAGSPTVEWAVFALIILAFTTLTLIKIGDELERIFKGMLSELENYQPGS